MLDNQLGIILSNLALLLITSVAFLDNTLLCGKLLLITLQKIVACKLHHTKHLLAFEKF